MVFFEIVAILSLILILHTYVLYPFIFLPTLALLYPDTLDKTTKDYIKKHIAIIVPAHNEETVIENKIKNLLSLKYPLEKFKIFLISDSSSDNTLKIMNNYKENHPNLIYTFDIQDHLGKTNAINKTIKTADLSNVDILLFTDANVFLDENILIETSKAFNNESIGGVAGQLTYINEGSSPTATENSRYWKYEENIKLLESKSGSLMGADGSIFAIKKDYYNELPVYVLDDFCTSMNVIFSGSELKFFKSIKAYEKGSEFSNEEFYRKIRISNRSYNSYKFIKKNIFFKLKFINIFKFISHKLIRWHSFSFMSILLLSNLYITIMKPNLFWLILLLTQIFLYLCAYIGYLQDKKNKHSIAYKFNSICYFFFITNFATFIGVLKSIRGEHIIRWKKAESTR